MNAVDDLEIVRAAIEQSVASARTSLGKNRRLQQTLRMQQHEMLMMDVQQELLQEMLQMQIQLEMRERQLQELDDPDDVDELTDQECIDKIVKTLSSNRL